MINTNQLQIAYTPDQVAKMLQLSKNTVYELISRGEIVAKKIGKVYRIPQNSLSFFLTGLDTDIAQLEAEDSKNLEKVNKTLREVRKETWAKSESF